MWLFVIPWTIALQALYPWDFSSQEHWSGLPFPSPGDLPSPGIEPMSPGLEGRFFATEHHRSPFREFCFLFIFYLVFKAWLMPWVSLCLEIGQGTFCSTGEVSHFLQSPARHTLEAPSLVMHGPSGATISPSNSVLEFLGLCMCFSRAKCHPLCPSLPQNLKKVLLIEIMIHHVIYTNLIYIEQNSKFKIKHLPEFTEYFIGLQNLFRIFWPQSLLLTWNCHLLKKIYYCVLN